VNIRYGPEQERSGLSQAGSSITNVEFDPTSQSMLELNPSRVDSSSYVAHEVQLSDPNADEETAVNPANSAEDV
jgi:hypothetical protein